MNVEYDEETDALALVYREVTGHKDRIIQDVEIGDLIYGLDREGKIVEIQILNASKLPKSSKYYPFVRLLIKTIVKQPKFPKGKAGKTARDGWMGGLKKAG